MKGDYSESVKLDKWEKYLMEQVDRELEKTEDKQDWAWIDECNAMLDEIREGKDAPSAKIKDARLRALRKEVRRRKNNYTRPMTRLILAAALILCASVSVFAASPVLREMVTNALNLDVGSSTNIVFRNNKKRTTYATIDELLVKEGLEFKYPIVSDDTDTDNTNIIKSIERNGMDNRISIRTRESAIVSYLIFLGNTNISYYNKNTIAHSFNGHTTYSFFGEDGIYYSYTLIDDDIHMISAKNMEVIEKVISSIPQESNDSGMVTGIAGRLEIIQNMISTILQKAKNPDLATSMLVEDPREIVDSITIPAVGDNVSYDTPISLFKYATGEEFLVTKIKREVEYVVFTVTDTTKDFFTKTDRWDTLSFDLLLSDGTMYHEMITKAEFESLSEKHPTNEFYRTMTENISENDYVVLLCKPDEGNNNLLISNVESRIKDLLLANGSTFEETVDYYNMHYIKQKDAALFGMKFYYRK